MTPDAPAITACTILTREGSSTFRNAPALERHQHPDPLEKRHFTVRTPHTPATVPSAHTNTDITSLATSMPSRVSRIRSPSRCTMPPVMNGTSAGPNRAPRVLP